MSTALESIVLSTPKFKQGSDWFEGKVDGNEWQRLFFSTKLFNLSSHSDGSSGKWVPNQQESSFL